MSGRSGEGEADSGSFSFDYFFLQCPAIEINGWVDYKLVMGGIYVRSLSFIVSAL